MNVSEFELIRQIKLWVPKPRRALGIGDDTAILSLPAKHELLVTTDTLVEGIDFNIKELSAKWIGRKALAVNLSDIAAMGGMPFSCVVNLGIPSSIDEKWIKDFYHGFLKLARRYEVDCVGGDISKADEFFVSVTLLGFSKPKKAIKRSTAKKGDWIAVTGRLGGSIRKKHYQFEPRLREGRFLAQHKFASSMIDVSDGFFQDLNHILSSSHKQAEIFIDQIPISSDVEGFCTKPVLQQALSDGEDFELLFTVPRHKRKNLEKEWKKKFSKTELSFVGKILRREWNRPPVSWLQNGKSISLPFELKGFDHFREK